MREQLDHAEAERCRARIKEELLANNWFTYRKTIAEEFGLSPRAVLHHSKIVMEEIKDVIESDKSEVRQYIKTKIIELIDKTEAIRDYSEAGKMLDRLCKLFGANEPDKIDVTTNNIIKLNFDVAKDNSTNE